MYFGLIDGTMKHFDKETHVIITPFHWQWRFFKILWPSQNIRTLNKPILKQTQLLTETNSYLKN